MFVIKIQQNILLHVSLWYTRDCTNCISFSTIGSCRSLPLTGVQTTSWTFHRLTAVRLGRLNANTYLWRIEIDVLEKKKQATDCLKDISIRCYRMVWFHNDFVEARAFFVVKPTQSNRFAFKCNSENTMWLVMRESSNARYIYVINIVH